MSQDVDHNTPSAQKTDLAALWAEAEIYGFVNLTTFKRSMFAADDAPPRRYSATIAFDTVEGVELRAQSDTQLTVTEALRDAIEKARSVVRDLKNMDIDA